MEDARRSLINLTNFPAVARWSRIKDRQMNRSVDEEDKEERGKREEERERPGQEEGLGCGRTMPRTMNPSSPRTYVHTYDGSCVHGGRGRAFIVSTLARRNAF